MLADGLVSHENSSPWRKWFLVLDQQRVGYTLEPVLLDESKFFGCQNVILGNTFKPVLKLPWWKRGVFDYVVTFYSKNLEEAFWILGSFEALHWIPNLSNTFIRFQYPRASLSLFLLSLVLNWPVQYTVDELMLCHQDEPFINHNEKWKSMNFLVFIWEIHTGAHTTFF